MKRTTRLSAGIALALLAPAAAQALPLVPNVYVGVEGGQGNRNHGQSIGKDDHAFDYGGYVGVELPSMPFGYLAVEANIGSSSGKTFGTTGSSSATFGVERNVKWNWSGTARAGVNIVPGLATYGILGYGAEKAQVTSTLFGPGTVTVGRQTFDGLIYGVGARYTVGSHVGVRIEYRKRQTNGKYDPEQIMGGLYFRI